MDLIPPSLSQPALYPGGREPVQFRKITDDDRLVYFAKYSNASLGQVKQLYLNWVRAINPETNEPYGPMSSQCQELNRLFSQCVDGNRITIPGRLKSPPTLPKDATPSILEVLHKRAQDMICARNLRRGDWHGYDFDALDVLLSREDIAMSEFEAAQMAFRWCRKNEVSFEAVVQHFDFNNMADEEKAWILEQLPASPGYPSMVLNALCSSRLVSNEELYPTGLSDERIRWKCVYDSSQDRIATFHSAVTRSLELFQRKLVVFRPDNRLTVAIYIPRKIERATDCLVDDSVHLIAFPHSQGEEMQSRLMLPTKKTYRLYCDENVFQLFENQRANSWVFIGHSGSDDTDYRNTVDVGVRRRQRQATIDDGTNCDIRASIALDKFSQNLQRQLGRVNRSPVLEAVGILVASS
jgi:hypothetical protein